MSPQISSGRRRAATGAVVVAVCAAAAVVATASSSGSPTNKGAVGSTSSGSATVQRRNLVATDTESGTLSYADQQTVYNRLSGTVTWLPAIGTVIHPGQTLFEVDNKPVLLMNGKVPAFRELSASDSGGPDIRELNANLVKLGYNPDGIVVNDTWQSATTAGVDALQAHLGETQTGKLTLGQIVFLPGPQLISSQAGTVGATAAEYSWPTTGSSPLFVDFPKTSTAGPGSSTTTGTSTTGTSTTGTGSANPTTSTGTSTIGTPTTGTQSTPTATTSPSGSPSNSQTLQTLIAILRAETAQLQNAIKAAKGSPGASTPGKSTGSPNTSGSGNPSGGPSTGSGGSGGNATAILQTTSTKLVVTVDLSPSLQGEAQLGEAVKVEMPNGTTVGGHISAISAVAQTSNTGANNGPGNSGNGGSTSAVPVTVTLDRRARGAGLDQAAVSVYFARAKAKHVLSIPITALLATSGGDFAVQEAAAPHSVLPVTTGLFAAGYVQISGPGIQPGLQVTDSQG